MRPLVRPRARADRRAGQLGILAMREECQEGRGKFSLRWERRPHRAGRERQQGRLPAIERKGAWNRYGFTHARGLLKQRRDLGLKRLLP
jgi:hypothetical protein